MSIPKSADKVNPMDLQSFRKCKSNDLHSLTNMSNKPETFRSSTTMSNKFRTLRKLVLYSDSLLNSWEKNKELSFKKEFDKEYISKEDYDYENEQMILNLQKASFIKKLTNKELNELSLIIKKELERD